MDGESEDRLYSCAMIKLIYLLLPALLFFSCNSPRYCYLVRHAEKLDATANSVLSPEGEQRALALRDSLREKNIELVFSTNFNRTRQTAEPLASAIHQSVLLYKPMALDSMVSVIHSAKKKNILIVGHSNTIPPLIEKLIGTKVQPIKETEYDNFYVVEIKKENKKLVQKKYGKTSN
jgi:broad specificity phosphatase PhoE